MLWVTLDVTGQSWRKEMLDGAGPHLGPCTEPSYDLGKDLH